MRTVRRISLAVAAGCALFGTGAGAAVGTETWAWFRGDDVARVGRADGTADLTLTARGSIDLRAAHVRLMSDSGEFRLVVPSAAPFARLNAYVLGTANRKPLYVGAPDGQDVVALVVRGTRGQQRDLQQWLHGSEVVAAIDGKGRLRLGNVTLYPEIRAGRVVLFAIGPDGKRQLLAIGEPVR